MPLNQLTVLILTLNEEANIQRTLDSLRWADSILVIDSGSTDRTLEILQEHKNARVLHRVFDNFADQCNFGLADIQTPWVLSIDADYVFPADSEMAVRQAIGSEFAGFEAAFEYCIRGYPVKGGILPPRTVLFKRDGARYEPDGHGHHVVIPGEARRLPFRIRHDDRKPLSRWLRSQINYAREDAAVIYSLPANLLSRNDRLRKWIFVAPWLVFLVTYVVRGGFLSGWRGLYYALQRLAAEILLSLFLIDMRLSEGKTNDHTRP